MPRIGIGSKLNNASKMAAIDTSEYTKVRLDPRKLVPSEQNFYSMTDIEELADNMLLVGQLQEIVVGRVNGVDKIIVGHRRTLAAVLNQDRGHAEFNLVDCKMKEMTETMFMLTLLSANAFNRNMTDWELIEQARLFKEYLQKAKEEGIEIPGKMRDYIASAMGVSTGKMGQIEKINNSLCEEGKEALKKGEMSFDKAYNTARLPEREQKAVIEDKNLLSKDVKAMVDSKNQDSNKEGLEELGPNNNDDEKACEGNCFFCEIDQCDSKQQKRYYCMYDSEKRCSIYGARKVAIETLNVNCESTCCMKCNLGCGARCNHSKHSKVSESDTEEIIGTKETVHEIKIANCYFEDVKQGIKKFELRKNDRDYKVGDKLKMMEFKDGEYTGRMLNAVITFILEDYEGIKEGYCILSIDLL
nr:DUF3850 domain-containing protein [uncultured Anaerosporobacter sp.]